MAFTLEPKAGPHVLSPSPNATASQNQADSAKARAMAALMGGQQTPPVSANISVEELGALKTDGQRISIEEPKEVTGEPPIASNEVSKEPGKGEPLSDKYAALARRERQLRNDIRAFKEQQAQAAAKPTATFDESKYIPVDALENDLLGTLSQRGYSYDKIVEQALNAQTQDPATKAALARLEAQIRASDERNTKLQASLEEQQTSQRKQAVSQIKAEASSLVKNDPNFETIKETNSIDDVVELIEKTFDQDGILLSVEEAAQAVEDHLLEEAMKLTKIGKIQQRLKANAEANATKATPTAQTAAQPQQQSKTLTNTMGTSRQLSARERAILAAKGELK